MWPSSERIHKEKQLPLKCLLVMDNFTAYPQDLYDYIPDGFNFIKVKFLPPNTTPLLKPMDQQVISNFKKLYTRAPFQKCFEVTNDMQLELREFLKGHLTILNCLTLIDNAWTQVTNRTLNSAWKKPWPDSVAERVYEWIEPDDSTIIDLFVSMGKSMELKVEREDVF